MLEEYPRFLVPGAEPFDALELARATEEIVCQGDKRKYTDFYATGVYGGIATGYTCGCCLRCVFCWVGLSRDFPERYGNFYSAQEAFNQLQRVARKHGVQKGRISGAEPTLGKAHLLKLLELIEGSSMKLFILETNGILFGADEDYVREITHFSKVHTRVSLKAGTPEDFTRKTGARAENFELPFRAIEYLIKHRSSFHVAAMSADQRVMNPEERHKLLQRLQSIHPALVKNLEEEIVDPYETTLLRLKYAGLEFDWRRKRF